MWGQFQVCSSKASRCEAGSVMISCAVFLVLLSYVIV